MNRFFRWLEAGRRDLPGVGKPDDVAPGEFDELRRLWELSSQGETPPQPDEDRAWNNVRRALVETQEERSHPVSEFLAKLVRPLIERPILSSACAAAAAVFIFLSLTPVTYRSGELGPLTVTLPDSSSVTLGAHSTLSWRRGLPVAARRVRLQGEAFFDVSHRGNPFIVETSLGAVQVLGTRFDVRCDTALYVAVSRGVVAVTAAAGAADTAVTLRAGDYLMCARKGVIAHPGRSVPHDAPVWMGGAITVAHADLRSVCDELSRQLGTRIVVAPGATDSLHVTGILTGRDVDQALLVLSRLTGTQIRHDAHGYAVY